jgi:hypothetical protein
MDHKPWLPLVAAALVGSHLLAAKASQMRARMRGALAHAGGVADAEFDGIGPSKPWSSMASRMIHVIEEYSMIMITAFFVAGMVGMLVGL